MKTTYDLLKSKGACAEGLRWFKKTFPDGCELTDDVISKISDCPTDFVWWFYNEVQQDKRLYKLCGVNGSDGVNGSNGVNRSNGVNWSNGVNRSFGVLNSFGVDNALFLVGKPRTYTVFGKEVSADRYDEVYNALYVKLNGWRPTFNNIKTLWIASGNDWKETPIYNAEEIAKEEAWRDMPKAAVGYVKSLPEFDSDMFYQITGIQ